MNQYLKFTLFLLAGAVETIEMGTPALTMLIFFVYIIIESFLNF